MDVDGIVSAHTHLPYDHEVPIGPDAQVGPVISTGQYGERFGHLNLQVDPETKEIVLFDAEVLDLWRKFAPDPPIAPIVTDAIAVAEVEGSVPLGNITADFNRAIVAAGTENRGGESTLGNFVADVQLWAGQQWASLDATRRVPVLALMNPGGLRADLKYAVDSTHPGDAEGLVTYQEAAGVQPFANTLDRRGRHRRADPPGARAAVAADRREPPVPEARHRGRPRVHVRRRGSGRFPRLEHHDQRRAARPRGRLPGRGELVPRLGR